MAGNFRIRLSHPGKPAAYSELMAGHVPQNWNTIYPSLLQMCGMLEDRTLNSPSDYFDFVAECNILPLKIFSGDSYLC
jgi:hypothetical protein